MITAVILDDELSNINILKQDLAEKCPEVSVLGAFTNAFEAQYFLENQPIDVLFLDISMPQMNGFEFLSHFPNAQFSVIFVSAYEEYALQAFEFYAVDYLLKPVNPNKLQRSVQRIAEKQKTKNESTQKMKELLDAIQQVYQKSNILSIPTLNGLEVIELHEIRYLVAEGNYVAIHLKSKKMVVSKSLGDFEKVLDSTKFLRIHNSYMVNLAEIKKYIRGDGGLIELQGGVQLPVSRINKPRLLQIIRADF